MSPPPPPLGTPRSKPHEAAGPAAPKAGDRGAEGGGSERDGSPISHRSASPVSRRSQSPLLAAALFYDFARHSEAEGAAVIVQARARGDAARREAERVRLERHNSEAERFLTDVGLAIEKPPASSAALVNRASAAEAGDDLEGGYGATQPPALVACSSDGVQDFFVLGSALSAPQPAPRRLTSPSAMQAEQADLSNGRSYTGMPPPQRVGVSAAMILGMQDLRPPSHTQPIAEDGKPPSRDAQWLGEQDELRQKIEKHVASHATAAETRAVAAAASSASPHRFGRLGAGANMRAVSNLPTPEEQPRARPAGYSYSVSTPPLQVTGEANPLGVPPHYLAETPSGSGDGHGGIGSGGSGSSGGGSGPGPATLVALAAAARVPEHRIAPTSRPPDGEHHGVPLRPYPEMICDRTVQTPTATQLLARRPGIGKRTGAIYRLDERSSLCTNGANGGGGQCAGGQPAIATMPSFQPRIIGGARGSTYVRSDDAQCRSPQRPSSMRAAAHIRTAHVRAHDHRQHREPPASSGVGQGPQGHPASQPSPGAAGTPGRTIPIECQAACAHTSSAGAHALDRRAVTRPSTAPVRRPAAGTIPSTAPPSRRASEELLIQLPRTGSSPDLAAPKGSRGSRRPSSAAASLTHTQHVAASEPFFELFEARYPGLMDGRSHGAAVATSPGMGFHRAPPANRQSIGAGSPSSPSAAVLEYGHALATTQGAFLLTGDSRAEPLLVRMMQMAAHVERTDGDTSGGVCRPPPAAGEVTYAKPAPRLASRPQSAPTATGSRSRGLGGGFLVTPPQPPGAAARPASAAAMNAAARRGHFGVPPRYMQTQESEAARRAKVLVETTVG